MQVHLQGEGAAQLAVGKVALVGGQSDGDELARLGKVLRLDGPVDASKRAFAEMLVTLARRHDLLRGRRKPLRVLGEMAGIAEHRLGEIALSDVKPRPETYEKLAAVEGAPSAVEWWRAIMNGHAAGDDRSGEVLTDADRALLEATANWPDEEKYRFAESLRRIQELGRADNNPS